MNKDELIPMCCLALGIAIGGFSVMGDAKQDKQSSPYFIVTNMVQCKAGICNAVLDMDDIAILVPYDSTKVHVGDTLYIVK